MKRSLFLLSLLCAACGTPASPSSSRPLNGTWTGIMTAPSTSLGSGAVRLNMIQDAAAVSGTWSVSFAAAGATDSGGMNGTLSGTAVSLTFRSTSSNTCPVALSGTLTGQTLTGSYSTFSCDQSAGGTFTLNRQ